MKPCLIDCPRQKGCQVCWCPAAVFCVLAFYPPYHSKYNPIERCWGILENHWSGTLLNILEITLEWAKTMTWKGVSPVIKLMETTYQKGVKMSKKAFKAISHRIDRDVSLPKYYMTIQPQI